MYVQAIDGGNPVPVDVQGSVLSHTWSPDGRELACVLRQGEAQFLVVVPAFFGGSPRASVPIEAGAQQVTVARWVGDKVFVQLNRGAAGHALVSITLTGGLAQEVSTTWPSTVKFRSFGLSANGRFVAFSGILDGRSDLWLANLDGSEPQRLTDDDYIDRYPVWVGNEAIVFQSNRGGQLDLWRLSVATRRATQITSSHPEEVASDASADGGIVVFEQLSNSNNLWRVDVPTGASRQLTGDALGDYWPSVSEAGARIAFQRTRPTPHEGFQFLDARVFVAPLAPSSLEAQPIADGFSPRLSADGAWLAYYQRLPDLRHFRLLVKNLATGEERTISDRSDMQVVTAALLPVEWLNRTMTWSPTEPHLYFIVSGADGSSGHEVHRVDLQASGPPVVLARADAGARIVDLAVSPDGQTVAWLETTKEQAVIQVLTMPQSRKSLPAVARESGASYYLAGWSRQDAVLVKRSQRRGHVQEVQLIEVPLTGPVRTVATIDQAAVAAVGLDMMRGRVMITRNEQGVHNIYAVSLRDGATQKLTNNESPGVSFSGIQPLRADAIVFAREERKRDIWVVQRKTP